MLQIRVKPGIEDRIRGYFPWIYRPEIASLSRKPKKGEIVTVRDFAGKFLGYGYINPEVSISIRILSFDKREKVNEDLIRRRIEEAYKYRRRLNIESNAMRVIHSEGDLLPGLIVDKYDDYLVVEFTTYGMSVFKEAVIEALIDILDPKGIYEKMNEFAAKIEGIETNEGVIYGEVPDEIIIWEHDLKFKVNIPQGQKTGFFLDQRNTRKLVRQFIEPGDRCLDVFCHTGGFALNMKKAGAKEVIGIDISEPALRAGRENAKINGLGDIKWVKENAFDFLKNLYRAGEQFDVIVIDPPSFAKNRASVPNALRGYHELCVRGLKLTKPGGYLAVFSCSFHITENHLMETLTNASYDVRRQVRVVAKTFQDLDHPWILQMPNTLYLKGVWVEVI